MTRIAQIVSGWWAILVVTGCATAGPSPVAQQDESQSGLHPDVEFMWRLDQRFLIRDATVDGILWHQAHVIGYILWYPSDTSGGYSAPITLEIGLCKDGTCFPGSPADAASSSLHFQSPPLTIRAWASDRVELGSEDTGLDPYLSATGFIQEISFVGMVFPVEITPPELAIVHLTVNGQLTSRDGLHSLQLTSDWIPPILE